MSAQLNSGEAVLQPDRSSSISAIVRYAYFPLLLPLLLVAGLYAPTTQSLARSWNDYDNLGNTHGWLILLVVVWLLYETATSERRITLRPSLPAIAGLAALSTLWMLLARMSIQSGQQILWPVLMWLSIAAFYGYSLARRCVFPLAYLYFAIPFWATINFLFQWGTVFAMRLLLRAFGIPAYFQGNELHLPAGTLVVEGGCSGLHFFIVAMAIAVLCCRVYAIKRLVVLLAFAAGLAVLTNWLRVFIIAVAGYLTDMQHYLIRVDHYRFGWMLFAISMAFFFYVAGRMPTKLNAGPSVLFTDQSITRPRGYLTVFAVLALALGPLMHWTASLRSQDKVVSAKIAIAPQGWLRATSTGSDWNPIFANADDRELIRYHRNESAVDTSSDVTVEVFHAVYAQQRQDKKLSGFGNTIVGAGYQLIEDGATLPIPPGFARSVVEDEHGQKWVVVHTYYVGSRYFAAPAFAQAVYGLRSIFMWEPMGVFAIRAECKLSCDSTISLLQPFVLMLPDVPPLAIQSR